MCQQPPGRWFRRLCWANKSSCGSSPPSTVLPAPSAAGRSIHCPLRYSEYIPTTLKKREREKHVHISDEQGQGEISGRGKSPKEGDISGITAKFSLSSRGCLQGVKRGDNGEPGWTNGPRGASLARHLSSQTPRNSTAVPVAIFKIKK